MTKNSDEEREPMEEHDAQGTQEEHDEEEHNEALPPLPPSLLGQGDLGSCRCF